MTPTEIFAGLLRAPKPVCGDDASRHMPVLALAPMQDVTTLQFMRVISRYGGPDVYWTEYFRVHGDSRPEKWILDSIIHNPTGRPVVAHTWKQFNDADCVVEIILVVRDGMQPHFTELAEI